MARLENLPEVEAIAKLFEDIGSEPLEETHISLNANLSRLDARFANGDTKRLAWQKAFFNWAAPFLESSDVIRRGREKPLGYAGDYLMIDMIYTQYSASMGIGSRLDELFHLFDAPKAVRNRKQYFVDTVTKRTAAQSAPQRILNVGAGPGREVHDLFLVLDTETEFPIIHCVDIDKDAITYAAELVSQANSSGNVSFEARNALRLNPAFEYDLVWSAGLFDYLTDKAAVRLIKRLWNALKPEGQLIIGNFHSSNSSRNFMEWCGGWFLIHRSDEEMRKLFLWAGIPPGSIRIDHEATGAVVFGIAQKNLIPEPR